MSFNPYKSKSVLILHTGPATSSKTDLLKRGQMRQRGAGDAQLIRARLLHLVPLVPRLELLRDHLPGHQPDGMVGVLFERRRSRQSGVRWRQLGDHPRGGQGPFRPPGAPRFGRAAQQEALLHVLVLRREWGLAGGLHRAGGARLPFLLRSKVEAVRRRAELGDLSGAVPAGRAQIGGG